MPALLLLLLACGSGCIWLPNWPFPDTIVPGEDFEENDSQLLSHCSPHQDPGTPVLLRRDAGPISFSCRVRNDQDNAFRAADTVLWEILLPANSGLRDSVIATGVERVDLYADDLPWSPRSYRAELKISVGRGTTTQTSRWLLIVPSHADDLAPAEDGG